MKLALPLALVALAVASVAAAGAPKVGEPAPPFRVTTLTGTEIALEDLRGSVVVLNFWATWCVPCRRELPLLDSYLRAQEQHGLRIVAVTTEDSAPASKLKPLAALVSFPMARRFRGSYGTPAALPMNFVIDRAGIVRYAKAGAFNLDSLNAVLVPLLRETVQPAPVAPAAPAP